MFHRYPCVRQADQSDCGAAALATIALHYRWPIALQRLRRLAGTDRVGINFLGLLQAAEAIGFNALLLLLRAERPGRIPHCP